MAAQRLDRRTILKGVGALGAVSALAAAQVPRAAHADDNEHERDAGVEGAWLVTVTNTSSAPGPSSFEVLAAFAAGGVFIETDQNGPGTEIGIGSWEPTGHRTARLTFIVLFSGNQGSGMVTITGKVTVDEDGRTLSGSDTGTVMDMSGHTLDTFSQTITGTRIEA